MCVFVFSFFIIPSLSTRMLVIPIKKKKSDVSNGRFNKAQEKRIGGAKFKVCGPMDYEWA